MKVFVISDTHFPFHNKSAYRKVMKLIKKEKPTHVVQIGDLLDQYIFSKYTRSLSVSAEQDVQKGLKQAQNMWSEIKRMLPKAKCFQLLGNHDVRLSKRILEKVPELESFFNLQDLYSFPGVKTLRSEREFLEIQGIVYIHGYLSKSIDHAKHFNKPVVHGHCHRPGITTFGSLFSMDVGFLADEDSLPMSYTQSKVTRWRMAVGIVENRQPRLILL